MEKRKKKQKTIHIPLHRHQDMKGRTFGKAHPLNVLHKNEVTQCSHKITLLNEKIIVAKGEAVRLRNIYEEVINERTSI